MPIFFPPTRPVRSVRRARLVPVIALGVSLLASGPGRAQPAQLAQLAAGAAGADSARAQLACTRRARSSRYPAARALVMPAVLAVAGFKAMDDDKGPFNQWDTREELQEHYAGFHTRADDFLIWAPYAGLSALLLAGVPARHAHARTVVWVTAKAALTTGILVQGLKHATAQWRPDGSARTSFPSGHTAQAFLGAAVLEAEFRESAPWVGPAAYTVATSVGALRMLNNRHWQSDVFVGAALGMAIGKVACLTQRPASAAHPGRARWAGTLGLVPTWLPAAGAGLALTWQPGQPAHTTP